MTRHHPRTFSPLFLRLDVCLFFCLWVLSSCPLEASPQEQNAGAFERGLQALKENRLEAALTELTEAEREHPSDARVSNFRGIVLARLGRNGEATAEYRQAIRLDPRMEDAWRNVGFLEWTEHRLDAAREDLQHALDLAPDDGFAHYYLGRVELDAWRYTRAFQELERSGVPWPADPEFLLEAAAGYTALGRQAEAREALARLQTLPLKDAEFVRCGGLLLAVHENDAAIRLFRSLNRPRPAGAARWAEFDLALAYLLAGRYQEAADQARVFMGVLHSASVPEAAPAWSLLGIAYIHLGENERGVNAFRRAAELAPGQEERWLDLTRELMELGQYAEAIAAVQEGLTHSPTSYALRLRLGAAYLARGRYPDAEAVFRDLVAVGDPLPTGYIGLAQVLLRAGRAGEAASELAAAQQKLGPNFLISYFRGLALDRSGRLPEAISAFQEALRLNPKSAEAHLGLGKVELAAGRVSEATAELKQVLAFEPNNVQAQRLLSHAYRQAGDAQAASKYAEQAAETRLPEPEGELVGDFFLPSWQPPP
jgi:tetratricopeptide (TPR) repeat protein